jgi:uncharacterized protein YkwD
MGFNFLTEQLDILIDLHNEARISRWLWKSKPLEKNSFLMNYAQQWSNKMAHKNKLFHSDMKDIMELGFSMVAENIAYGATSPEEVMKMWMNSSGHRSNILNSKFTEIGCGMSISQEGKLYWCTTFAR